MKNYKKGHADGARTEFHQMLGLTGAEVSINTLPAGGSVPFVHSHQENEEIYIIMDGKGTLKIALLAICATPIAIPLLAALFAVLFSVAICIFTAYLCIFALALSAFLIGGKLFIRGIIAIPFSASGSFIILGIGLFGIGLSILLCILGIYLCKWTCILFAKMAQLLIRRRRG